MTSPNDIITYSQPTTGGRFFRCSRRTAAHLDDTKRRLAKQHPGARLEIIQGAYNDTVAASAGTHDKDAVVDVRIVGLDWWAAQRFLRECGWAAWYRHTGAWSRPSSWHVHMVSLGYTTPVGVFVPGQVTDYYAHKTGLVGHAHDPSWFPPNIPATQFRYEEDDMPSPKDWSDEDWAAFEAHVGKGAWSRIFTQFGGLTAGVVLKNIARAVGAADK